MATNVKCMLSSEGKVTSNSLCQFQVEVIWLLSSSQSSQIGFVTIFLSIFIFFLVIVSCHEQVIYMGEINTKQTQKFRFYNANTGVFKSNMEQKLI
jgi:hypothetical protein